MKIAWFHLFYGITTVAIFGMLLSIKLNTENATPQVPAVTVTTQPQNEYIALSTPITAVTAQVPEVVGLRAEEIRAIGDYVVERVFEIQKASDSQAREMMPRQVSQVVSESGSVVTTSWVDKSGVEQSYRRPHERVLAALLARVEAGEITTDYMMQEVALLTKMQ